MIRKNCKFYNGKTLWRCFVVRKIWSKPITWGGYAKLCAVVHAVTAVWSVWYLEVTGLFSTLGWCKEKIGKIKKFIR